MPTWLLQWTVVTSVFVLAAAVMPSVRVRSWPKAFVAAAALGLANLALGWILRLLFKGLLLLPAILSFGLAYLLVPVLVNVVLIRITSALLNGQIDIKGLKSTLLIATALAVTCALLFG